MGKGKDHIPFRTCLSCGSKRDKRDLLRLARVKEGEIIRDDRGNMPGRGAYVCKDETCQNRLLKNRRIQRAFRATGTMNFSVDFLSDEG